VQGFQPEVSAYPVLEFRRDGLVLAEVRGVPYRLLGLATSIRRRLSFIRTSSIGIRVELVPKKPILTPTYVTRSGSSSSTLSTLPILS
jgi:hypothetical protein